MELLHFIGNIIYYFKLIILDSEGCEECTKLYYYTFLCIHI